MIKYYLNDSYLLLKRVNFRTIRRYILHVTKKHIAECLGIDEGTVRRAEELGCKIRQSTFNKIAMFFHAALIARGWKAVVDRV